MIKITNLCKSFAGIPVLKDISETIALGEIVSVIGPSGSGKSTLLRCINRLEKPDSGCIFIEGEDILAHGAQIYRIRRKTGMVFQAFNLFAHLNVLNNLTIGPMKLLQQTRQESERRAHELLGMVGLAEKAFNMPDELSGGQQQRVAIARCLSMNPKIILFDEPTSALDPIMVSEVLSVIRRLARDGMTMMIVTHEMDFARDVSSRIFYMDAGIIYESGSPQHIMDAPEREKTRIFINRLRNFSYKIDSPEYDQYELNAEIEAFCEKHFFGKTMTLRVLLVVEEVLALYVARSEHVDLTITLLYTEKSGELTFQFEDRNPPRNFLDAGGEGDELGLTILRGITHDMACHRAEHGNLVAMTLNENNKSA